MGFFGDLTDAVKKRMQDPPQFRDRRETCMKCSGSGTCPACEGSPTQTGRYVAMVIGVLGFGGSLASCGADNWDLGLTLLVGAIGLPTLINLAWRCECQESAFKEEGQGRCNGCEGKGYNIVQERIGGTDILQAMQQTTEATKLTREFGAMAGGSLKDMEKKIDRALELNPNHFAGNAIKGVLHFDRGENQLALQYLRKAESRKAESRKAESRKPKNIEIKKALCTVHDQLGNQEEADQKYMEAVALGVRAVNRKQMMGSVAAGAVGGVVASLVGLFVPFLDE